MDKAIGRWIVLSTASLKGGILELPQPYQKIGEKILFRDKKTILPITSGNCPQAPKRTRFLQ